MNVFDLAATLTLDTSEYEKGLKDAEGSAQDLASNASGLGDKLKSGLGTAGKVAGGLVVAGMAAAGAAVVNLTKQAVNNYAEYEQLVGGVETLFKDNADTVQQYAQNAYKTAGLSANEYMETVTSFSASLLQSLGGDTAQAAEMADLAITDMSDNANKMGSDMTSIQNAYQGFAKQNYTMLDNLKLGYGGTKEEMQRLIDDANKLREAQGLNADLTIDSYADIVTAIHEVQTEMGITGTTAQEASSTIQGSLGQAKAAWENLLTGFATEGADLDTLFSNFMDSAVTVFENVAPVVGRAVVAIVKGIVTHIPDILAALADMVNIIFTELGSMLDQFIEVGVAWLASITEGIRNKISDVVQAGQELWQNFKDNLHAKITEALEQGVEWIVNLIQGIKNKISDTVAAGAELWQNFKSNLASVVGEILAIGVEWIANLIQGIRNKISDTVQAGHDLIEQVKAKIRGAVSEFLSIGSQLIEGLKQGIINKAQSVINSVRGLVSDAIGAAKRLLGIASPSKVFAEIGEYLDEGLADGIEDKEKEPIARIKELANEIISIVQDMNKKVDAELVKTVNDVAYVANTDYAAAMLKAENIEEFEGLAKQRAAKIAGEGIDLAANGWASNEDLMKQWSENMAKQTADAVEDVVVTGTSRIAKADGTYSDFTWEQPININTTVKLDGKAVGEAAYTYTKKKIRMVGPQVALG